MIRRARIAGVVAATLARGACTSYTVPKVKQVQVDETHLGNYRKLPALACPYALERVDDGRPDHGDSGNYSGKVMHLENAPAVVDSLLRSAGLQPAGTVGARRVVVTLKQMYIAQQHLVETPVVVYGVQVADEAPFLVRSRSEELTWWGTKDEAFAGYSRALADANYRLLEELNGRCHGG